MVMFLCATVFYSCKNDPSEVNFEITSPSQAWTYYNDSLIVLSSSLDNVDQSWASSVDGILGSGAQIAIYLSVGLHTITLCHTPSGETRSVTITVKKRSADSLVKKTYLTYVPFQKSFTVGMHRAGVFSTSGTATNFCATPSDSVAVTASTVATTALFRDGRIPVMNKSGNLRPMESPSARSALAAIPPVLGSVKTFLVLNTADSTAAPREVVAAVRAVSNSLVAWVPVSVTDTQTLSYIDECISRVETVVLSRVASLWGNCADVNSDGSISLLFSPSINDEKVALGFFYSEDFFAKNTNKSDSSYNPYSNEMDVIYAAIPTGDDTNLTYSVQAIAATVAHELTHAVNFTNKTYKRFLSGTETVTQETFLDEGLSHLSETLCGFGVSGGNQKFVNYYLNNMTYFSFCSPDYLGRSDSVGQRGAMCLFLYWLFERSGGMSYDEADSSLLHDEGGISFLRTLVSSDDIGWKSIGDSYGKDTDELFKEFADELFVKGIKNMFDVAAVDPYTGEFCFNCIEPRPYALNKKFSVLQWSVFFFEPVSFSQLSFSADSFSPLYFFTE